MSGAQPWVFLDDRGVEQGAARVPERVVAYVRAGAALLDLGVVPVAVYGSGHDGAVLDPAKAGRLADAGVPYLGGGRGLDEEVLSELRPDLVVDVTYDGKGPYALDEAVVERLGVPFVVLSVGSEPGLPGVLGRFGGLAASLGGDAAADRASRVELVRAEAALRGVAEARDLTVLALSGAGPEQVHLARPEAWPELARLADLGVRLLDPGPGAGVSWLTADWGHVSGLRPDVVLFDARAHAAPPRRAVESTPYGIAGGVAQGAGAGAGSPAPEETETETEAAMPYGIPPREAARRPAVEPVPDPYGISGAVRLVAWNPETPPSPAAYARFFRELAQALAASGPRP